MTLTPLIIVPGTWEWPSATPTWYDADSPFAGYLTTHGWAVATGADARPFVWSTRATGYQLWDKILRRTDQMHADWAAAGANLYAWVVPPLAPDRRIPPAQTTVLTHSHGLQVALYAAAMGLKIHTLIDICGPTRRDYDERDLRTARANIGYWWHLHSDRSDWWQVLGSLGDGTPRGITRANPLADLNQQLPSAGHSKLLKDPTWMPLLDSALDWAQQRYNQP